MSHNENSYQIKKIGQFSLILGSLGVVFGDIGTSPLYALNEIYFNSSHGIKELSELSILGPLSLVFWLLTLIISIKYLFFVLKADFDGEGGVFALYGQLHQHRNKIVYYLKILLILSAGLLFGEAMITPAISILSAVEGLSLYNSQLKPIILPLAVLILFILFFIQNHGSHKLGKLFGSIALIWFTLIGLIGLYNITLTPQVLQAINPHYAIAYLDQISFNNILSLFGALLLVITGGEALFIDIGHFNKTIIRKSWCLIVYPSLILTYFGQASFLYRSFQQNLFSQNSTHLFYEIAPRGFLLPLVLLSACATFIASQALISALFSLSSQAIALGLFPRLKVKHTHHEHIGQIYVPVVNWVLFLGSSCLIFIFKSSNALASAYGLSLSFVMFTTTLTMITISVLKWKWSLRKSMMIFVPFLIIEMLLIISKVSLIWHGGFISLTVGLMLFYVMRTWKWGRKEIFKAYDRVEIQSMKDFIEFKKSQPYQLPKNVVLLVPKPLRSLDDKAPALIQLFLNRYGVLPQNLFLVEVVHRKTPFVTEKKYESYTFCKDEKKGTVASVTIHFGFMEDPHLEKILTELAQHHEIDLPDDSHKWLVHTAFERFLPHDKLSFVESLRFRTYLFLRQVTQPAYFYYGLGRDINLSIEILPISNAFLQKP